MIKIIVTENPKPKEQVGEPTAFKRRKSSESRIPMETNSLISPFDQIRMLDAESYPRAFLEYGGFRYEISRAALKTEEIIADVRITKILGESDD